VVAAQVAEVHPVQYQRLVVPAAQETHLLFRHHKALTAEQVMEDQTAPFQVAAEYEGPVPVAAVLVLAVLTAILLLPHLLVKVVPVVRGLPP
jgi:hypothetical protein